MPDSFFIKFWGVRGTIPVPGESTLKYGGNTACVEVQCGDRQIIFDAGTGLYLLGLQTNFTHTDILLSHTHLDHIQGFPFFKPLHQKAASVGLWAGHLLPEGNVSQVVSHIMQSPVFPLTLKDMVSQINFHDFTAGETLKDEAFSKAGITIHTLPLNHPDRATGYRLEYQGKSVCYITDVEHRDAVLDEALLGFIKGTDIFIYDCTFDDRDYPNYKGWGHSTWQHGVRLANAAGVKEFVAFHHDPEKNDEALDKQAGELQALRPSARIAKEGLVMKIG